MVTKESARLSALFRRRDTLKGSAVGLQNTDSGRTVRYWMRSWAVPVMAGLAVFLLAFGIWMVSLTSVALATGSAVSSARPVMIFGLAAGALSIIMASGLAVIAVRPALVLTPDMLRIIRAFSTVRIPVQEITGVGLVFKRSTPGSRAHTAGWWVRVWRDERGERVPISYQPVLRSSRDPRAREKFLAVTPALASGGVAVGFSLGKFDAATETDLAKLEATYAARVAREIYQRVLAKQGPAGPLAVTQQQKHVYIGSQFAAANILAFWSPDGVIGRAAPGSSRGPAT